jgi:hypothetical protein
MAGCIGGYSVFQRLRFMTAMEWKLVGHGGASTDAWNAYTFESLINIETYGMRCQYNLVPNQLAVSAQARQEP